MRKRIISLLLSAIMLFSLLPTTAMAEAALHVHNEIEFQPWKASEHEGKLPTTEGSYYLAEDVTLTDTWTVPTGETNLCLNGHVIKMTGSGSVITIGEDATLNLYDCDTTTAHYFTVDDTGFCTLTDTATAGTKTVTGGIITGGTGSHVENIVAGISGGGVLVNECGSFTMTGGTIIGNSARYGGGVFACVGASFTMTGGTITGNTVFESGEFGSEPAGGGVYFKMPFFTEFVTLGGTAKIIENSGSNLYLGEESAVQIGLWGNAPAEEMSVGVTTENGPYEEAPVIKL